MNSSSENDDDSDGGDDDDGGGYPPWETGGESGSGPDEAAHMAYLRGAVAAERALPAARVYKALARRRLRQRDSDFGAMGAAGVT
jgi:hypothetical protein